MAAPTLAREMEAVPARPSRTPARERDGTWLPTFAAAAALAILLAMTISTAVVVRGIARTQSHDRFEAFVHRATAIVSAEMRRSLTELAAIEGLLQASGSVSREEFEAFAATLDRRGFAVQALAYIPRVPLSGANEFTRLIRSWDRPMYDLTATGRREEYYPVAFTFPADTGIIVAGEDLYLRAPFREAIREAMSGGDRLVATVPARTGPGPLDQAAFVVFAPIQRATNESADGEEPPVEGFGLGVYRVGDFLAAPLEAAGIGDVQFRVVDVSPSGSVDEIYPEPGGESASDWPGGVAEAEQVGVAGRVWEFTFLSPPDYNLSGVERNTWVIVLSAGCALTAFATWSTYSLVASRRAVHSDLQLMNTRLRVVLDSALEGILLVDRERRVVWGNQAYAEAFGSGSVDEVIGREWSDIDRTAGRVLADESAYLARVEEIYKDETLAVANEDVELREPSQRTLSMTSVPVGDHDGSYLGRLWVFRDVTSERAADRAKSAFVSMVSHELRTPLTSVTGFVDLVMDGAAGPVSDDVARLLRTALSNGERLEALIGDILEVSRLESGPVMDLQELSLASVTAQVADSLSGEFEKRKLTLVLDVPESLPPVWADRGRMAQVLMNLLSNTYRYTPNGGRVTVTGRWGKDRPEVVELSVADTGVGIPEEYHDRIFERFVRVDSGRPRPAGSTGLGLSITKTLVELMGGSVVVDSAEGAGSIFTVTLPAAVAMEGAAG